MPLLGLTSAQAKLARWLLREATAAVPAGLAWLTTDLVANQAAPTTLEWRRFQMVWNRTTPTGTSEDRAQVKLDLLNVTSDELDVTWTSTDYSTVQNLLNTWKNAILPYMSPSQQWVQTRAYRMKFNPLPDVTRPFAETGPPVYVTTIGGTATGTGAVPYQIAPTVTFRTSWPKHWGRMYLPTPGTGSFDANGRLTSTYITGVQAATATLLGGLHDAGFYPVVPVGQLDKQPFHALLGVTVVTVDDVPDVQRRRRARQVSSRA